MPRRTAKEEIEALINATQQNRVRIQKTWQKVEDLEAAIESSKDALMQAKARQSTKKSKK